MTAEQMLIAAVGVLASGIYVLWALDCKRRDKAEERLQGEVAAERKRVEESQARVLEMSTQAAELRAHLRFLSEEDTDVPT